MELDAIGYPRRLASRQCGRKCKVSSHVMRLLFSLKKSSPSPALVILLVTLKLFQHSLQVRRYSYEVRFSSLPQRESSRRKKTKKEKRTSDKFGNLKVSIHHYLEDERLKIWAPNVQVYFHFRLMKGPA